MAKDWTREILDVVAVLFEQQPHNKALEEILYIFAELRGAVAEPLPWIELARMVTASERSTRKLADEAWAGHDYCRAIRLRGVADGLVMAREHHAHVIAQSKRATDTTDRSGS